MDEFMQEEQRRYLDTRMRSGRAAHSIPESASDVRCRCGALASHKVGEETSPPWMHNMTAYMCCDCFKRSIGNCEGYPYD